MKHIPKLMWCKFSGAGEAWPLTTDAQISTALEELRIRGWPRVTVYGLNENDGRQMRIGDLYADMNGLVILDDGKES